MKRWFYILFLFFTGVHNNAQASSENHSFHKNLSYQHNEFWYLNFEEQDDFSFYIDDKDFDIHDSAADANNHISYSIDKGRKIFVNQHVEFSLLPFLLPNLLDLPPPSDF